MHVDCDKASIQEFTTRPAFAMASAVQSLSGYAVLGWGYVFLSRVHHMPPAEIGLTLGCIVGIAGCTGAFIGGKITDKLGAKDARWYMRLPAIESLLGVPFVVGFTLFTL